MTLETVYAMGAGLLELLFSLVLAVCSIFLGIQLFDRLTPDIDEFKELKKGNVAVAIVLGSIILSMAMMLALGMTDFTNTLPGLSLEKSLLLFALAIAKFAWALVIALATLYVAFNVLDTLTFDVDETKELKKKNIAVAIFIASVLLAATIVIVAGARGLVDAPGFSLDATATALGIR